MVSPLSDAEYAPYRARQRRVRLSLQACWLTLTRRYRARYCAYPAEGLRHYLLIRRFAHGFENIDLAFGKRSTLEVEH
jgi:hypothetical protein